MMDREYDGWMVKNCMGKEPWLVTGFFERTRPEVIADFELLWGKGEWRKERRRGNYKLVKVKFMEVE